MYVSRRFSLFHVLASVFIAAACFAVDAVATVWRYACAFTREAVASFKQPDFGRVLPSDAQVTSKVTAMKAIAKAFHVRPNMTPGWRMCSSI